MGSAKIGPDYDILIIGAGISGINAAYRVQNELPADTSYAILERRGAIGGTWDLFKYPGIRSDSDIASFSFPWAPWDGTDYLGSGPDIQQYMARAARETGISEHIRYHQHVSAADWDSQASCWTLTVHTPNDDAGHGGAAAAAAWTTTTRLTARFIVFGTGYYNHDEPLDAVIPGIENFAGKVVHPQFWPSDLDYTGKNVVIIGSGATAVTLVPSMAETIGPEGHVTMLQRSPTYLLPLPVKDRAASLLYRFMPLCWASRLVRWWNTTRTYLFYWFCTNFPRRAIAVLRMITVRLLPEQIKWDPHFKPRYNPWDQRMCITPGADFFRALRSGRGSVVTDTIEQVTEKSIRLASGQELHPDIIVTATGLKICFGGGIAIRVDGSTVVPGDKFVWKAAMIQDVPNLFYMLGYTNASWTLGADVTANLIVRLLRRMRKEGKSVAVPRLTEQERGSMQVKSMFDLSSTYIKLASHALPKGGQGQWEPRTHYFRDLFRVKWGDIDSGLEMR